MVKFTQRDVAIIAGLAGVTDFLTEGRFSAPVARAFKKVLRKVAPPVARTFPRLGMTALQVGKQVALRHPVLTAGAVIYYTYKHKDEIADLVEQGYEITKPITQPASEFLQEEVFTPQAAEIARARGTIGPAPVPAFLERFSPKPRKPSLFNKAVKAGMAMVKKDKLYGGKGVIKPAKKAFSLVTKLASAKKKKKKAPKTGLRKRIWGAMKGLR